MCDYFEGKRILVTGGAGFIGSELVRQLCRFGAKVTVFDDLSSADFENLHGTSVELVYGDVRYGERVRAAMRDKDIVFHLASRPFIPTSYLYPSEIFDINARGTLNVLLAAIETRPGLLIHVSSSEVYGTAQYIPVDEEHPLNPQSTYAVSKVAAERLCYTFHKEHDAPIIIVRPFNTYGPRDTHPRIIPEAISQLTRSNSLKLGDLSSSRDLTYVDDIVEGILLTGQKPELQGEVINFGSGKDIKMLDLVHLIAELVGRDDVHIVTDSSRCRPDDVKQLVADNRKARRLLNWKPKISLRDGLTKTINWYLDSNEGKWIWEKRIVLRE